MIHTSTFIPFTSFVSLHRLVSPSPITPPQLCGRRFQHTLAEFLQNPRGEIFRTRLKRHGAPKQPPYNP
jgi:hypothetical protein